MTAILKRWLHIRNRTASINRRTVTPKLSWSNLKWRSLKAYFHYGCALRCVATGEICADAGISLATQRNATQRAAVMEIGFRFFWRQSPNNKKSSDVGSVTGPKRKQNTNNIAQEMIYLCTSLSRQMPLDGQNSNGAFW